MDRVQRLFQLGRSQRLVRCHHQSDRLFHQVARLA
jgi:hypothetical protein